MREILADALALAVCVEARRVHAGGAGHVVQFAVHPVRRRDDGCLRFVVLGDRLPHRCDPPAARRVVGRG